MSESFTIEPVDTTFDVDTLHQYAATLPYGARDAATPEVVVLVDSHASLESVQESRVDDPTHFPESVSLLQIEPRRVLLTPGTEGVTTARQFVQWLAQRYALRFRDHEWNDVTDQVRQSLDVLFEIGS